MSLRPRMSRRQKDTILRVINVFVTLLVVLQLWLLTATMNAYLGGEKSIVWPAAVASLVCFGFNMALLRHVFGLQNRRTTK